MKLRLIRKSPFTLIFLAGTLLPGLAKAQSVLIDADTRNGSFELLGPPPGVVDATKATLWDSNPVDGATDVTYWNQFPGAAVMDDSGTEIPGAPATTATGVKWAFLKNGNAAYNMTDHVIQAGDTFTFMWDSYKAVAHNFQLVYAEPAGAIIPFGAAVPFAAIGNNQTGTYTVAPGDPAVGKTVGIKMAATAGYPALDNVRLEFTNVPPTDTDNDGLPDSWEMANFNDLDEVASGDPDADGLNNSFELNTSFTLPNKFDSDDDSLGDGAELGVAGVTSTNSYAPGVPTNPLLADSDHDGVSDSEENGSLNIFPLPVPPATTGGGAATDPNNSDSDGDFINDYEELAYHSDPNDEFSLPEPSLHDLINNTMQNGDFELRNGQPNTIKTTQWDAPAPNDVDFWTEWTGVSTVADNSGVEGGGTHGLMRGFFRNGNAAYNLTPSIGAAGKVYACNWKQVNANGATLSVQIVYEESPGVVIAIPASLATTSTAGGIGHLVYRIPAGSAAIGRKIGIGVSSVGNWIGADEFVLNIADSDSDDDGLGDFYEDQYFGNNDGNPIPAELALQSGNDDFDSDDLINIDEIYFGTLPNNNDTDGDGLEDGAEVTSDSTRSSNKYLPGEFTDPLSADSDNDGVSDKDENGGLNTNFANAPTNPNSADTDDDGAGDKKELAYGTDPNDDTDIPAPVVLSLINNTLRNGSFEMRNGELNTVKTTQWDAPAPDDIDNWTDWPGVSIEKLDSGVEAGGSDGEMWGFFQAGNAAYNMTDNVAAEGAVYAATWKHLGGTGLFTVELVFDDGAGNIVALPGSLSKTTGGGQIGDLVYQIPTGSLAIGKTIGIGVTSSGGYMQVDEVSFNIAVEDSDHDGLADPWEIDHFGNLSEGPNGDSDGDGTNNLTEFRLYLNPKDGSSRFTLIHSAIGVLQWQSAAGTAFKIQRSSTMEAGSWMTLEEAFSGSSYIDPAPPEGNAFYKVGLNP